MAKPRIIIYTGFTGIIYMGFTSIIFHWPYVQQLIYIQRTTYGNSVIVRNQLDLSCTVFETMCQIIAFPKRA